ncbi:hypothetical protein [Streptomyces sp. NPDC051211]|uniref:hypothetical protein n=1 Tax=Streptomyces sp. NPDC051211 TaxID=3154643 RepID=UPI00344C66F5
METATSPDGATAINRLAAHLRQLVSHLDPGSGWYGEFLRRDPEGMRACLDGVAMPPWDVLESLLQDLAAARGEELAARARARAAELRQAAVTAYDRLPGGAEELRTLLAAAGAQHASSEAAMRALSAQLGAAADPAESDFLTRELSWTQDDLTRAASRCTDLATRLSALTVPPAAPGAARQDWAGAGAEPLPGVPRQPPADARTEPGPDARTHPGPDAPADRAGDGTASAPGTAPAEGPAPGQDAVPGPPPAAGRRWLRGGGRRGGGARYAGMPSGAGAVPELPQQPDAVPRGARYGRPGPEPRPSPEPAAAGAPTPAGAPGAPGAPGAAPGPAAVPRLVAELIALRGQGRTGEAHALLCEAAGWPAARLPGLARELERAGLAPDWATLLWEAAATLPSERLVEAAAALGAEGREADRGQLLRQGVSRPAAEIAEAALALREGGRTDEAEALLAAFVRVRPAEEAARLARRDPHWLAPRLLDAAAAVSAACHRDLVHALRVAGLKGDRN